MSTGGPQVVRPAIIAACSASGFAGITRDEVIAAAPATPLTAIVELNVLVRSGQLFKAGPRDARRYFGAESDAAAWDAEHNTAEQRRAKRRARQRAYDRAHYVSKPRAARPKIAKPVKVKFERPPKPEKPAKAPKVAVARQPKPPKIKPAPRPSKFQPMLDHIAASPTGASMQELVALTGFRVARIAAALANNRLVPLSKHGHTRYFMTPDAAEAARPAVLAIWALVDAERQAKDAARRKASDKARYLKPRVEKPKVAKLARPPKPKAEQVAKPKAPTGPAGLKGPLVITPKTKYTICPPMPQPRWSNTHSVYT